MIKVLWIDDQEFEQLENIAEDQDVDLTHVYSWREAERKIKGSHFDEWDAIIFDCYCTMEPGGNEDEFFLKKAFKEFYQICGVNRIIPWYILSQGNGDRFENIISNQLAEDRLEWDGDWEKVYYSKTTDYKQLLANIKAMAPKRHNYDVRHRYMDFFNAVKNVDRYGNIEELIFPILKVIHYPKDVDTFNAVDYYNKIRKVVEQLFYSCNRLGILPDELITENRVNLSWSSHYLSGNIPGNLNIRYGEAGESFFPPAISNSIKNILKVANINSHSADLTSSENVMVEEYFSGITAEYIIIGLAMNVISVILWFEEYLNSGHLSIEENKKKCVRIVCDESKDSLQECDSVSLDSDSPPNIADYEGKEFLVERDERDNYHCGKCRISYKVAPQYLGKKVVLYDVVENTTLNKDLYPYFARFKVKEVLKNGSKNEGTNQS